MHVSEDNIQTCQEMSGDHQHYHGPFIAADKHEAISQGVQMEYPLVAGVDSQPLPGTKIWELLRN